MALDKIDFSSIFGDKIGGIDFINGLITGDNANEMGVENSNGIKTETMDFSGETNQVNIPATGSSTGLSNTETGTTSNMPITESNGSVMNSQATNTNATTNQMQSNSGVGFGQQQNQNIVNGPYAENLNNNQMANNESQIGPQQVKITETEQEEKNEVSNNSTGGSGLTGGSSSTSGETTDSNVSSMSTNSATGEKGENKEGTETKGEVAETGKDIQKDLRTRTQYQYDVEENSRKDSVDSAMKEAGLEEGEFDKYIDILEKTIKSEEGHIQFSEENELRLVRLYGKKDNATGKYPNAKELLDIIYSKDPNKKINFMPLTGKDSEKRTEEIWEEIYEDAKTTYKDNKIFQKESYKKLTEEEKTEFIKELAKEKIKTAYQEERKSVYENNYEIDIEGNKGGLGLYKAKDFDSLTEEEKIEFIGRKCNHREGQLTFSTDEVKEWGDGNEYQDDYINGMTDSIADRKISVKQLKYMKKEVEMQKEIYKYEKIVYTDDYKNYTEKGTIGTITTTDTHGALRTISEDIYKDKKKYLNSEQNKILDYIYNKEGQEKADEYIHALRGQIAKGQGIEQANEFLKELESDSEKMNTFMEIMKDKEKFDKCLKEGFIDGIGTFGEGVKNFFSDDYELSALEWKEQAIMSVLSNNIEYSRGWCDKAYQFGNVVGNLAPSMLASAAVTTATGGAGAPAALGTIFNTTGELAGSLAMMISAAGNAKHQALVNGAGTAEAWAYGICSGLSEATMERFLGAIPGLSRLEGGYFKKIISEGIEEGSQEFVSAMLNSVILGEDIDIGDLLEQAKESFGMGSAVSAVLNVGSLKKSNVKLKYNGKTIKISESTREKIQEQIGKVNEGEIDVEVGNQNAIDLLEAEIKKQVGKTENIDAKEVENIEVKEESNNIKEIANEEKTDKISESEDKITKERADEKDSKELYEMDSKLKKAAQDIKKINKQEKQEKKEAKKLEKVKTKQERVRITDEISLDENSSLEEVNKAIREDTTTSSVKLETSDNLTKKNTIKGKVKSKTESIVNKVLNSIEIYKYEELKVIGHKFEVIGDQKPFSFTKEGLQNFRERVSKIITAPVGGYVNIGNSPSYERGSFVALSDFHGADWVLDKVGNHYMNEYETIFNLGDITDRGKEPFKLLLDYMELSKKYPGRVVYVPGNHDSFIYGVYRAADAQQCSNYKASLTGNGGLETYQQMEELRKSNPHKFNELLDWLGSQPLQRVHVDNNGKKYALAHAFFNNTLYKQNQYYSLKDYMKDVQYTGDGIKTPIGNILWFRKGKSQFNPADLPSSDYTMIIGHTANANNLDLGNVKVIDVDGAASRQNSDGTYSTRKYDGGDDVVYTVSYEHKDTSKINTDLSSNAEHISVSDILNEYTRSENEKYNSNSLAQSILYKYAYGLVTESSITRRDGYRDIITKLSLNDICDYLGLDVNTVIRERNVYATAVINLDEGNIRGAIDLITGTGNHTLIEKINMQICNKAQKSIAGKQYAEAIAIIMPTNNENMINQIKSQVYNEAVEVLNNGNVTDALTIVESTGDIQLMNRFNGQVIRYEVNNTITEDMNPIEKARKIYIELNKRVSYDENYLASDRDTRVAIFHSNKTGFDNMSNNNQVICKSWSEIYKQLLIDNGFNESDVYIAGGKREGYIDHQWIIIDMEKSGAPAGSIIIADATEEIAGNKVDLFNCKASLRPCGFIATSVSNLSPEMMHRLRLSGLVNGIIELEKSINKFESLDNKIGYSYSGETISKADALFNNEELNEKISAQAIEKLKNITIPPNMSGLEGYLYLKRMVKLIAPVDTSSSINIRKYFSKTTSGYEVISVLTINENNQTSYYTYSIKNGNHIFTNDEEFFKYFDTLNIKN